MDNNEDNTVAFSTRRFGLRDKIGYLFGDCGNDFFFMFASSYLMVFYTDVFGLKPAFTGMIFLVARFWDAFMDVAAGRFIDSRPTTKNGKFKPWIIRFSPILLLFGILMFTKVPGLTAAGYLTYAFITYILWGTFYSFTNIPYGSMASVISKDPIERASLSTFRSIGANLANIIVTAIVPILAFVNNKADGNRFFMVAVGMAVFAMFCYIMCYRLSTERVIVKQSLNKKTSLLTALKGLIHNRPFISQVSASLVLIVGQLFQASLNAYLFKDYFKNTAALSLNGLIIILNIVIVAPAVEPLIKKFGKKEVSSVALAYSSIGFFLLYLLPIKNAYLFVTLTFVVNLGFYVFNFMLWAFVTDIIDYQELITGEREDGTVYSFYTFARKIGQAIAGMFGGIILQMSGYVKAPHQTAQVAQNIRNYATLIPAIAYFIVFLCIAFWYPLNKEKLEKFSKQLEFKRLK